MNTSPLKHLARRIQRLEAAPLTRRIDRHIRISTALDDAMGNPALDDRKLQRDYHASCESLLLEASRLQCEATALQAPLADLDCSENGGAEGTARRYSRKLKAQQLELLAQVADEVDLLGRLIAQSDRFRELVRTQSDRLRRTERMLGIVRERIAMRPSTLPCLDDRDGKIRQLDDAVRSAMGRGTTGAPGGRSPFGENGPTVRLALGPYHHLAQDAFEEIRQRQRTIAEGLSELKEGFRLFNRLITRGYSRRMRGPMEILLFKHDARIRAFRRHVRQSRQSTCC